MRSFFHTLREGTDWLLVVPVVLLSLLGLVTMNSFTGQGVFFERQMLWIILAFCCMFAVSFVDIRIVRNTSSIVLLYSTTLVLLVLVLFLGTMVLGARNRFDFGFFAFQPGDIARLVLVLVLAKYFARRHLDIAHIKHILVSGTYCALIFFLLFLEPDFGSGMIVFLLWFGMVLVVGISRTHLALVFAVGAVCAFGLWHFALHDYQKVRVISFIHPLADIRGAGYNAYQSTIAVGSGGVFGKGIGNGTQSKLEFLPEYQTDFIFAAFAEEWGLIGVGLVLILFGILFYRLLVRARHGATNFETLVCVGIVLWFFAQIVIHIGMNVGLLPVTGTTIPFLSYGGSHLITEYVAIGIVLAMQRYELSVGREYQDREMVGIVG